MRPASKGRGVGGYILVTVMVFMAVIMALAAALIEHFLVAEAREVETSLDKIRVYWAMMGHVDYVGSRYLEANNGGGNGNGDNLSSFVYLTVPPTCPDSPLTFRCIFEELDISTDSPGVNRRQWTYETNDRSFMIGVDDLSANPAMNGTIRLTPRTLTGNNLQGGVRSLDVQLSNIGGPPPTQVNIAAHSRSVP